MQATIQSEELKHQGRIAYRAGLVWGNNGNISARLDEDTFIISASGTHLEQLADDDIVICRVSEADYHQGSKRPSSETPLHRAVYRARPEAGGVIHCSPFYTTLVACTALPLRVDLIPEAMAFLGSIGRVPYNYPGQEELASNVGAAIAEHPAVLMENHGAITFGHTLEEAVVRAETLEVLCRLHVVAQAANLELLYLGQDVAQGLRDYLREKGFKA